MDYVTKHWQKLVDNGVGNKQNAEQARMLNAILLIAIILCMLLGINAFVSGRIPNAYIQLGRVTGVLLAYYVSSLGKHKAGFVLFLVMLVASNVAFLIFQPYNVGNSYSFLAFLLLVYYFLDDNRERVIYFILLSIIGTAYYVYEQNYMLPAPSVIYVIAYLTITVLVFFLLRIFRLEIEKYKKESEAHRAQLAQNNEELLTSSEAIQIALEAQQKAVLEAEMATAQLKSMQNQLVQSEKMGSLTKLITGAIERLNNPLNFISGGLDALNDAKKDMSKIVGMYQSLHKITTPDTLTEKLSTIKIEEDNMDVKELLTDVDEVFKDIRLGVDQTMEVLHDLSAFTYKSTKSDFTKITNVSLFLKELIGDAIPEFAPQIKVEISPDFSFVLLDPKKFGEALIHFLRNAFDANAAQVILKVWTQEGKVSFSVQDNGSGMEPTVLKQAPEPFFSTKPKTNKGLGLAVASHIVLQHSGELEIQSEPEKGTTIFVTLPTEL